MADEMDGSHPFLICTRDQFPQLAERAEREPWKTMVKNARARVEAGYNGNIKTGLSRYIGACALLYLVDEHQRQQRAELVRDAILLLEDVRFDPKLDWTGTVPTLGAAFVAIIALDLAYDDLSSADRQRLEQLLDRQLARIPNHGAWLSARLGTHGTWALFKDPQFGKTQAFRKQFIEPFYNNTMRQMTVDGVTTVSPSYAFARLGASDSRPQKSGFADILEFTGLDNRYYDNPKLQAFYRWLYGYSITPARDYHLFGDVGPYWPTGNASLFWRVGRFDDQAAAYAAWMLEDAEPPGHILSYILMDKPLAEPIVPPSQLFEDGGAVFREPADSPMSLGAALYNITENPEWHTHEETNAISLAAYGNRLLVNGGWLGDATRPPQRNNTLTIDNRRHDRRTGAGLLEGLTGAGLDYARGDSGGALGNDTFLRSLILVHGNGSAEGYFVVVDDVDADPDETIQTYFQLASEDPAQAITSGSRYRADINHHAEQSGVTMELVFASQPTGIEQTLVPSGDLQRLPKSGQHYALEATYDTDAQGDRRLLTVAIPMHGDKRPADVQTLDRARADAMVLDWAGDVRDIVVASKPSAEDVTAAGVSLRGEAAICRQDGDQTLFYFVSRGTRFDSDRHGFTSRDPVSLYLDQSQGRITSDGTRMTLRQPGLTGVKLNGQAIQPINVSPNTVEFDLPAGRHDLELLFR